MAVRSDSWRRIAAFCAAIAVALAVFAPASRGAVEHVIHISVDGLHPGHLQTQINAGFAPHFKRFQDEGAWTNNARTDYTHTNTLPNHTSMLTGRPVSLPVGMSGTPHHGYTDNDTPPAAETLHNFTTPDWYKASSFDVAHDAGLSTALYASKNKFVIYEQSYNAANGAPHANGADKIDRFFGPESTASMQSTLLTEVAANNYDYTFIHYADLDDAGHGVGWGTPTYMTAIVTVNNYLGQVFNLVETDPQFMGNTAIVLSADHGGTGTGHSGATNASNYTIPFYVWGAGVAHGDLYALNAGTRTNPSTGRPDYLAAGQPIRNGDGGNLALSLLGLGPIPGSMINSAQNLRVSLPGDFNLDNKVDAADYVAWQKGVGVAAMSGQYSTWQANFGYSLGGGGGGQANVPEPAGVVWILLAVAAVLSKRRCSR
jgi:Type I phosphodiesterase / nucleotide pyrophosphatase